MSVNCLRYTISDNPYGSAKAPLWLNDLMQINKVSCRIIKAYAVCCNGHDIAVAFVCVRPTINAFTVKQLIKRN